MKTNSDSQVFFGNSSFLPSIYIKLMDRTVKNANELFEKGLIRKVAGKIDPNKVKFNWDEL